MKRIVLIVFLFFSITTIAQNRTTPYAFPVRPGTAEWQKLRSTRELYDATQIPAAVLKDLTTEALVKTVLQYPNLLMMYAFNDLQMGFEQLKKNFNGFQELLQRKDAGAELLKVYEQLDPMIENKKLMTQQQGRLTIEFQYMEVILSQYEVLRNFSEQDRKRLSKLCLKQYDGKKSNIEVFSRYGLESTALIMGRMLELTNQLQKTGSNNNFLKSGKSSGEQQLNEIYERTKAYAG